MIIYLMIGTMADISFKISVYSKYIYAKFTTANLASCENIYFMTVESVDVVQRFQITRYNQKTNAK